MDLNIQQYYYIVDLNIQQYYYIVDFNIQQYYYIVDLNIQQYYYIVDLNIQQYYYIVDLNIQQYYYIVDLNIQKNTLQINIFVNIVLVLILGGGVQLPVFGWGVSTFSQWVTDILTIPNSFNILRECPIMK